MENETKELAKLKRLATEIAGEIHDLVEDRFMTDYQQLAILSQQAIDAMEKYYAFKKEHRL